MFLELETTGSSSDSLQLHPFFKMGTSLKGKNLLPEGVNYSLRAVPYGMENKVSSLECNYF